MCQSSPLSALRTTIWSICWLPSAPLTEDQGYSADLITDGLRGECVIRLLSYDPSYGMDIPIVVEGRLPETAGEIAVDARQSDDLHLSVGDTLVLRSDDGDIADILKGSSFTVVGRITSPLWPTDSRGTYRRAQER